MIKSALYLSVTIILLSCAAKNKISRASSDTDHFGIGLLEPNLSQIQDIPIYLNIHANTAFDTIRVFRTAEGRTEFSTIQSGNEFHPMSSFLGDSYKEAQAHINSGLVAFGPRLVFRVLDKTATSYTVIIDEYTRRSVVIKIKANTPSTAFSLDTWETYMKRAACIAPLTTRITIYTTPNGQIKEDARSGCFKVLSIADRWAQIADGSNQPAGWIKWRDDSFLLISAIMEFIE